MQSVKIDRFLRLGIVVLAVLFIYVIYAAIHQRIVEAGDKAPQFTITTDTGKTISVPDFGGKLLVLNFWASWCQPCVEESPWLSDFARQFANKGVVVLGVSVDKDPAAYRKFLERFRPAFQTVRDSKIHEDYGTFMYPETYIIDANGRVLKKFAEEVPFTHPKFVELVNSLL